MDDFDDNFHPEISNSAAISSQETHEIREEISKVSVKENITPKGPESRDKPPVEVKKERVQNFRSEEPKIESGEMDWNSTVQIATENMEEEDSTYDFTDDKNLCFYWLDAHEQQYNRDGKLYLTGKIRKKEGGNQSCCLQITNIPHVIYVLPRENFEMTDVYEELDEIFEKRKIQKFKSKPVHRKNFFGGPDVPQEAEYMRVEYEAKYPVLERSFQNGKTFSRIFNAGQDLFEFFALERTVKVSIHFIL